MIERYSREPMRSIFSDENRFKAYLEVELFATEAWSKLGVVPENDVKKLFENAKFDLEGILELEKELLHLLVMCLVIWEKKKNGFIMGLLRLMLLIQHMVIYTNKLTISSWKIY